MQVQNLNLSSNFLLKGLGPKPKPAVHVLTYPKTGTFLIFKTLKLLDITIKSETEVVPPHIPSYKHIKPNKPIEELFDPNKRYIVLVRDPRERLLSVYKWLMRPNYISYYEEHVGEFSPEKKQEYLAWKKLTLSEKLDTEYSLTKGADSFTWSVLNSDRIKQWPRGNFVQDADELVELSKLNKKNILFVKFEDLVGPEGGGTREAQIVALSRICAFNNVDTTPTQLKKVAQQIYGDTHTFTSSNNKCEQWKKTYTPEHIRIARKLYNNFLVHFGYEANLSCDEGAPIQTEKQNS